jgi:tetratricopeptide (TPR) repeat protein
MQAAARIGFSRLLTRYAIGANSLAAADQAIQLTPADPDAHRARATVLNSLRRFAEAESSLETATNLRKGHASQWLELGTTREELGDNEGALTAFDQAVLCAPYYGQTHWQRGNLLLRLGRYDEAFADLREAAASNPKFLPNAIDLAWNLTGGAIPATEDLLQLHDDQARLAYARFLAGKGLGAQVVQQVRLLSAPLSDENKEELVRLLAASRKYADAFELAKGTDTLEGVVNGGFEQPLTFKNVYFRWVIFERQAQAKFALDVAEKFSGGKSLQITFNGEWSPGGSLLSQTIVAQPGQRYRLSFAVKTKDLVTGGAPRIVLTDATNDRILAKSDAFPQATNGWQQMNVEFTTPSKSEAVVISLAREKCSSSPCPIFGVVWLDEFALLKL